MENRTTYNKRLGLGGDGSSEYKQGVLEQCLRRDANAANDAILAALEGEQDRFNKYLAVSIDFFNNYLFGKDEDNFKQVVIRGLIREYKPWVLPDADDASKSPLGRMAREVKENALALGGHHGATTVSASPGLVGRALESPAPCGYAVGARLTGKVNRVEKFGAFVEFENGYGLVRAEEISTEQVDDARDCVKRGQRVEVEVIGIDRDKGRLDLSMRRCG